MDTTQRSLKEKYHARLIAKFSKEVVDAYLQEYSKIIIGPCPFLNIEERLFDLLAIFHVAANRGDISKSLEEAKNGIYKTMEDIQAELRVVKK